MSASLIRFVTNVVTALALVVCASTSASAATAVAISDTLSSVSYVGRGATIEQAEQYALAICNVQSRNRRVIPACRIFAHTEKAGWFAVACGQLGCGASLSQNSLRVAQDIAFEKCFELQKFCDNDLAAFGSDFPESANQAAKRDPSAGLPAMYRAGPAQ